MNRILAVVFYLALAGHALAQGSPVKQSGTVTPGHVPVIVTTNVIGDGGAATNGVVTNLGLLGSGLPLCINDAPTSSPRGYHQLCLGANALGGGLLSYNAHGGASALPMQFNINGMTFQPPVNGGCYSPTVYGADATGVGYSDAALSTIVAAIGSGSGCIQFGPGTFKFASGISMTLGARASLSVLGAGSRVTALYWPTGQGISISLDSQQSGAHFAGLALWSGSSSGGNNGILITQTAAGGTPVVQTTLDDITLAGYDFATGVGTADYWAVGISTVGVNNVNLRNIFFWGNEYFNGVGIEFAGTTTNEAVIENVSDSFFQNDNEGVLIGPYVQGVTIRGSNFSGNHAIYSPNGSYQLTISDNQFVTTDHDIDITGEDSAVSVIANLFFIPSSKCGLYINSGSSYEIIGNNFQPVASATSTTGVCVPISDAEGGNVITGNSYGGISGTQLTNGNVLGSLSNNWNVQSNAYTNTTTANTNTGTNNTIGGGSP